MRKILIHIFWGVYIIKLGKKKLSFLRASTVLAPSLLLAGILKATNYSTLSLILLSVFVIGVVIDFLYLKFFPPVWEELSPRQKASLPMGDVLEKHWAEYIMLKNKYGC